MLHLYHAEPVANSMKSLLCLKETGLDARNARPAVQAALAMPNKVPEVLRTFGG
jgi:hypothetical protein